MIGREAASTPPSYFGKCDAFLERGKRTRNHPSRSQTQFTAWGFVCEEEILTPPWYPFIQAFVVSKIKTGRLVWF